jgi:hypothetical protein
MPAGVDERVPSTEFDAFCKMPTVGRAGRNRAYVQYKVEIPVQIVQRLQLTRNDVLLVAIKKASAEEIETYTLPSPWAKRRFNKVIDLGFCPRCKDVLLPTMGGLPVKVIEGVKFCNLCAWHVESDPAERKKWVEWAKTEAKA